MVEFFAGSGKLTQAHCDLGMRCSRWDKEYGPEDAHDVSTPDGLATWLSEIAHTCTGALLWFGTQCSSFLTICKFSSGRSADNQWLGSDKAFIVTPIAQTGRLTGRPDFPRVQNL